MKRGLGVLAAVGMATAMIAAEKTPLNQRQARPSPAWLTGGVLYQIQPRAFTPEGTLKAAQARLPRLAELGVGGWVHATPYIQDMPRALAAADLAVSRAGAMALAELCAWGVPSVLVPFPHAAANHQHHNAVALAQAGAAVLAPESELEAGRLWGHLSRLAADAEERARLARRARERGHPDAAARIVDSLSKLL